MVIRATPSFVHVVCTPPPMEWHFRILSKTLIKKFSILIQNEIYRGVGGELDKVKLAKDDSMLEMFYMEKKVANILINVAITSISKKSANTKKDAYGCVTFLEKKVSSIAWKYYLFEMRTKNNNKSHP